MSLLFATVFRHVCRNTHERLAIDALRHLRGPNAERWTDLFLHHHSGYLRGAEAPDKQFKDFGNHVLHVREENWGGATREAARWYGRTVDSLQRQEWYEAVYSAGVLSHYFSDPFMPLHTARTEEDTRIHAAMEWSIAHSYGRLQQLIEHDLRGYPHLEAPRSAGWIERMVVTGAELAHEHYQVLLDHFDLPRAARDPLAAMDQECQDRIAMCLGHAVVGLARVFERAFEEAAIEPPAVETTLQGFLVALAAPIHWLMNSVANSSQRMTIDAIADEAERSGKVLKNLPESDREIRQRHAEEVLRIPLHQLNQRPAAVTGTLYGTGATDRHVPNRLITTPILRPQETVSLAWRDAQERVEKSRQAA